MADSVPDTEYSSKQSHLLNLLGHNLPNTRLIALHTLRGLTKMPNEGLIPAIQRQIRNGIGAAGDTVGNYVNSNGKAIQDSASAAGRRVDGVARSVSGSGKTASKSTTNSSTAAGSYVQSVGRTVSRQIESYGNYAGRQVGTAGKYVDGSGRAVGGRVGDFGNQIKDKSGARGAKMSTPKNPLGLSGTRTV